MYKLQEMWNEECLRYLREVKRWAHAVLFGRCMGCDLSIVLLTCLCSRVFYSCLVVRRVCFCRTDIWNVVMVVGCARWLHAIRNELLYYSQQCSFSRSWLFVLCDLLVGGIRSGRGTTESGQSRVFSAGIGHVQFRLFDRYTEGIVSCINMG